jgi:hypothetical protein
MYGSECCVRVCVCVCDLAPSLTTQGGFPVLPQGLRQRAIMPLPNWSPPCMEASLLFHKDYASKSPCRRLPGRTSMAHSTLHRQLQHHLARHLRPGHQNQGLLHRFYHQLPSQLHHLHRAISSAGPGLTLLWPFMSVLLRALMCSVAPLFACSVCVCTPCQPIGAHPSPYLS